MCSVRFSIREVSWTSSLLWGLFVCFGGFFRYFWLIYYESTVSWSRPKKGWEEGYKLILQELEILAAVHLRITEMLVTICSCGLFSPVPLLVGLLPDLDQLSGGFASLNIGNTPVVDPTASLSNLLTFFVKKFLLMSSLKLLSHCLCQWPSCAAPEKNSINFVATLQIVVGAF